MSLTEATLVWRLVLPVPFAERKRRFPRNHLSFVHTVAMKVPLIQITNNRFWDRLMSIPFSILGDQLFFSAKGVVSLPFKKIKIVFQVFDF